MRAGPWPLGRVIIFAEDDDCLNVFSFNNPLSVHVAVLSSHGFLFQPSSTPKDSSLSVPEVHKAQPIHMHII